MKDKAIFRMKQLFHYLGFIVERIPDEHKLADELSRVEDSVQRHILKKLTHNIVIGDNHKLYNNLLKKHVPNWNVDFRSAEFIGHGVGEYSFDSYRKIYIGEKCFFEKVYFNDTYDLLKIEWFYKHIEPLLNNIAKPATLYKIIKGDLITIVYFEFTVLDKFSDEEFFSTAFEISRKLIQLSDLTVSKDLYKTAPEFLKDYRPHFGYKRHLDAFRASIKELSKGKLTIENIEKVVDAQPIVLTHADIQSTNLFQGNYLIDWDSFGFFPIGFDVAFILYKRSDIFNIEDILNLLTDNYKDIIDANQWQGFELNCLYFYFVFTVLDEKTTLGLTLQKDVFDRLCSLHEILISS